MNEEWISYKCKRQISCFEINIILICLLFNFYLFTLLIVYTISVWYNKITQPYSTCLDGNKKPKAYIFLYLWFKHLNGNQIGSAVSSTNLKVWIMKSKIHLHTYLVHGGTLRVPLGTWILVPRGFYLPLNFFLPLAFE